MVELKVGCGSSEGSYWISEYAENMDVTSPVLICGAKFGSNQLSRFECDSVWHQDQCAVAGEARSVLSRGAGESHSDASQARAASKASIALDGLERSHVLSEPHLHFPAVQRSRRIGEPVAPGTLTLAAVRWLLRQTRSGRRKQELLTSGHSGPLSFSLFLPELYL